ncbi:oleoyl-acyl carrier protein thioesterase 1, chloroplastic isoform X2 [Manihot esculenta]|uniref:oleoyl-acyl carrier protein thioesterase 1, chloroplastic isoform X2 n=1 Tax=Manihot esculenta TaxID=3983 RepID=UPI001CC5A8EC|nr:oleoyl-acyl carrier protein thioesterase 1, chloroplastic isoform X2 [Manihot esculenta]
MLKTSLQAVVSEAATTCVNSMSESLANRLRLGNLTEDGLSYKERFIVRSYEVGINKTATVETIANFLQRLVAIMLRVSDFLLMDLPQPSQ